MIESDPKSEPRFWTKARVLWTLVLSFWILMAVLTHLPKLPAAAMVSNRDKIAHFSAFAILSALLTWASFGRAIASEAWLRLSNSERRKRFFNRLAIMVALVAIYAALDEWLQPLTGRSCELNDWICDAFGATFGSAMMLYLLRRRHERIVARTLR